MLFSPEKATLALKSHVLSKLPWTPFWCTCTGGESVEDNGSLKYFSYSQVILFFGSFLVVLGCCDKHNLWLIGGSHWQESRSRKIPRRNYSLFSLSFEKIKFPFLFLFSIFKIFRKQIHFSSRFVRFSNPFSFSSWFSRFSRKNSLSLLDWWDSETQISFSSRFSRCWEKILFLFSIYEIFWEQISFSSQFSRCWEKFSSRFMRFLRTILFLCSIFKIFRNK